MLHAVVKIVEREVQLQHEMQGQNCAMMKLLCFLYFCSVLWSNVHHFGEMPASFFRVTGLIHVNVEVM